ncbi:MAG: cation:proton antiporter, partial [Clostridia bacterium]|nr:cation:proton antiporter [Clostridia bacterium]
AVGIGVSFIMPGDMDIKQRLFIGTILTATSVGITVAVLKDLGRLHGKVGTSIVTAAILDDIIGVVLLAFVTGNTDSSTLGAKFLSACKVDIQSASIGVVILNVVFFVIFVIAVGLAIHYLFKLISKKYPHTRRLPIFGLCVAFLFAWASEDLFGIAAISGAFAAGMMMSNMKQTDYVERRIDITTYMLFSPLFFASIGIGINYEHLGQSFSDGSSVGLIIAFSIAFVIFGMLAKLLGCGGGALMCKYKMNQSVKVGLGMMVRGEVCLIVAQKGMDVGLIDARFWPAVILLIVCSSLLTPILLKLMFKKYPDMENPEMVPPETSEFRENTDSAHAEADGGKGGEVSADTAPIGGVAGDVAESKENKA